MFVTDVVFVAAGVVAVTAGAMPVTVAFMFVTVGAVLATVGIMLATAGAVLVTGIMPGCHMRVTCSMLRSGGGCGRRISRMRSAICSRRSSIRFGSRSRLGSSVTGSSGLGRSTRGSTTLVCSLVSRGTRLGSIAGCSTILGCVARSGTGLGCITCRPTVLLCCNGCRTRRGVDGQGAVAPAVGLGSRAGYRGCIGRRLRDGRRDVSRCFRRGAGLAGRLRSGTGVTGRSCVAGRRRASGALGFRVIEMDQLRIATVIRRQVIHHVDTAIDQVLLRFPGGRHLPFAADLALHIRTRWPARVATGIHGLRKASGTLLEAEQHLICGIPFFDAQLQQAAESHLR